MKGLVGQRPSRYEVTLRKKERKKGGERRKDTCNAKMKKRQKETMTSQDFRGKIGGRASKSQLIPGQTGREEREKKEGSSFSR